MGFSEFSPGDSNSGIPCEEMESKSTIFNMKGSISLLTFQDVAAMLK